jgi:DNA-binding helix-hairpin-helix protein with protein kinase domain
MPKNFTLQNGATLSVADNPLGEGGEGAVYEILSPTNYRNSVAKILYPDKRTNERRYKVRYMVDNPPANIQDGNGHNFLIWPQQILLENNDFVGFIMPKAEGIDLEELCRVKLKPKYT